MSGEIKGALLAELIVVSYALTFFLFFGFGPTPRDYHSSWEFAAGVASQIMMVGTPMALVLGGFTGALAMRVKRRRVAKLVCAALGGCLAGTILLGAVTRFIGVGMLVLPAFGLAAIGALTLERWTRPSG